MARTANNFECEYFEKELIENRDFETYNLTIHFQNTRFEIPSFEIVVFPHLALFFSMIIDVESS